MNTPEGHQKAVATTLQRNPNFFKEIGAEGGRKSTNRSKPVLQFTLEHKFVARHKSCRAASRATNVPFTSISASIKGRLVHAGGFVWRFEYEK
jgi:hypothetical protein